MLLFLTAGAATCEAAATELATSGGAAADPCPSCGVGCPGEMIGVAASALVLPNLSVTLGARFGPVATAADPPVAFAREGSAVAIP